MRPHLFADERPPAVHVAGLGDLGGALGAALLVATVTTPTPTAQTERPRARSTDGDRRPPGAAAQAASAQPQLPRDKRGWQVAPAPDGRGTPPSTSARRRIAARGFLWFVVGAAGDQLAVGAALRSRRRSRA